MLLVVTGCRHHQQMAQPAPQSLPPPVYPTPPPVYTPPPQPRQPSPEVSSTPSSPIGANAEDLEYVETHRPIETRVGLASWYEAPYKGRRAANGKVFDGETMTAANRTLPMGSLIKVTNLKTGQSGVMRVTDRGPFVEGRIVDLSRAAAIATGIYRPGIARVRLDVYETPKPIESGGHWCVQIGPFTSYAVASRLKRRLIRKYPRASVIEFPSERHYWVRIRPHDGDRAMAEYLARHLRPSQGEAYLTRLD
ncbi:MAG: septal ring lytic transglycosylase RlpA family protein [Acidobacteriota bacterium]